METISRARRPWETGGAERQETPYAVLAAEIIRLAVKDYVKAVRRQIRNGAGENDSTAYEIQRLEQFFRSDTFEFYTAFLSQPLDGEVLICQCRLRAEEAEKYQRKTGKEGIHNETGKIIIRGFD